MITVKATLVIFMTLKTFDYCTSLVNAMQSLITQHYTLFIITIGCSTVAIYCTSDHKMKLFDSHARNAIGMLHDQGTCLLLEITSLQDLHCYLQRLHPNPNALFEVKGVQINCVDSCDELSQYNNMTCYEINHTSTDNYNTIKTNNIPLLECCCAISLYSLCFFL